MSQPAAPISPVTGLPLPMSSSLPFSLPRLRAGADALYQSAQAREATLRGRSRVRKCSAYFHRPDSQGLRETPRVVV